MNLDSYFHRIGYKGSRAPTAETLAAIHTHHASAIPFENFDVLLGRGIKIDPAAIARKLIDERRGGYCFEQNSLLADVLRALGYRVTPMLARVRWKVPIETPTALTHLVLRVECDAGPFLADVGFGSMSLYRPLVFEYDTSQQVSLEKRRLILRPSPVFPDMPPQQVIVHQAQIGAEWLDVYHFTGEPAASVDAELGNWFTSCHAQSRFKQNVVAARTEETYRCTLLNRDLKIRHRDGRVIERAIQSPAEMLEVLEEYFLLSFPAGTRFEAPELVWPA